MASNGKNGKKGRLRRRLIWTGVLTILLAGAFFGVKAAFKPDNTIDASKLAEVTRGSIARSVVATGKIQPRSKVDVKSKASGIVEKILADYGDWVKQGQVLAELDKEELRARVRESSAELTRRPGSRSSRPRRPTSATRSRRKGPICLS